MAAGPAGSRANDLRPTRPEPDHRRLQPSRITPGGLHLVTDDDLVAEATNMYRPEGEEARRGIRDRVPGDTDCVPTAPHRGLVCWRDVA